MDVPASASPAWGAPAASAPSAWAAGAAVPGLSRDEIAARVREGRVNTMPPLPGRSFGQILRANVLTRFNAILGSLLVVVAVVGPLQDGLFGAVIAANTAIGIFQEVRSKRTLDRLAILSAPRTHALRSGRVVELAVEEVVIDDVLELHTGDQVPVDAVVLRSDGAEADESLLTGEAQPVSKEEGDALMSGSFVVAGNVLVRATAVGGASYASRIEAQARRFNLIRSELQQGTNRILRLVTWVMVPAGAALVTTQVVRSHQSLPDALRASVAGVSAMVPEGLVLLTSVAFAAGALRLARRRVLVQELAALEGLARVDILLTDKTGTLTAPGMTVRHIEPVGSHSRSAPDDALASLVAADPDPNQTLQAIGKHLAGRPTWDAAARVPFSSARKWGAASFPGRGSWVMGAPEIVAPGATEVLRAAEGFAAEGRRVVLVATTPAPLDGDGLPLGIEPVALVVLDEILRDDASATIAYLLDQGVTIKVLSGDAPVTVAAVAQRAGVPVLGTPCDASALAAGDGAVGAALDATNVLGRVQPEQKLAAVRALQERGHVVAMVGDGVNDVQALKQADLGIAMGAGSAASRSVARIVLLDSAFSAVPPILDEARRVIANIERIARLFVTKTVYAALLATVVAITAVPYPFFPRHLTIVSTLTIGVPGFFLAFAPGAPRAHAGFTSRVLRFTIPAGVAAAAATFVAYAVARSWPAVDVTAARSTAMLVLFGLGFWILVLVARPLTIMRIVLVACMAAAIPPLFAIPGARSVLDLAAPPAGLALAGLGILGAAIAILTAWRALASRATGRARDT